MRVGVGYSEVPDTEAAGKQAASEALRRAGRDLPCDLVLLFSTARHDAGQLRESVASVIGQSTPIVGGGAVGAISNDRFGYAGDQVILAAIWLEEVRCELLVEPDINKGEAEAGKRLGARLAALKTTPESPVFLFYDAVDTSGDGMRLNMATYLLKGIEQGLGFLPQLVGAGLQGDHACSSTPQWTGAGQSSNNALTLSFSGNIRVDSVIMHGCRPSTGYYTVTKADEQTILEIDHQPALEFIDGLLDHAVPRESFPFFLIFGVNKGDKWGEYDADRYASRLCLGIDPERSGIVMFEPDMVEGTEFQIMYRSLGLDYMPPRIEEVFSRLDGREPVFAVYINCAGRAAGYGGLDLEDALVVQDKVAGQVPLLGIYTGVEIAPVDGRPQGLDWTGVFCLFSVQNEKAI